jgi:hypothetical protein
MNTTDIDVEKTFHATLKTFSAEELAQYSFLISLYGKSLEDSKCIFKVLLKLDSAGIVNLNDYKTIMSEWIQEYEGINERLRSFIDKDSIN